MSRAAEIALVQAALASAPAPLVPAMALPLIWFPSRRGEARRG